MHPDDYCFNYAFLSVTKEVVNYFSDWGPHIYIKFPTFIQKACSAILTASAGTITGESARGAGEGIRTPEPLRDRSLWTHSI